MGTLIRKRTTDTVLLVLQAVSIALAISISLGFL
jgi:hypothetical protein